MKIEMSLLVEGKHRRQIGVSEVKLAISIKQKEHALVAKVGG